MVFTPDAPFPKSRGHVIKSKDWNDAITELQRLDTAKVNKAGDNITGPLTIAGNVGIGTTTPENSEGWSKVLDVLGGAHAKLSVRNSSIEARVMAHGGWWGAPAGMVVGTNTAHSLSFGTNKATRMTIDTAGNVGIGLAAPQSRLHVRSLTAIDEGTTGAGAWANFGSNAFFDGTWKRIDTTKAGVNLHMNPDGGGIEFRFLRQEADGSNLRNIAVIGSSRSFINEGNVGIGTTTPGAKLDVSGSGGASQCCAPVAPTLSLAEASRDQNRQAWLQFHNAGEAEAYIRLAGGGPAGSARAGQRRFEIGDNQGASTALQVLSNSNPIRFTAGWTGFPDTVTNQAEISNDTGSYQTLMIVGNRSAGLGRRVSVWDRLEVNGSAFKPGGGSWSSISDVRLKKGVKPLKGALGKLLQLRGVSFKWKKPEEQGNLTGTQMGLVAQQVEEVLPEWVDTDPSGYKNLTVRGFEALTVEAFRELTAENEALKSKSKQLEERIKDLEVNVPKRVNDREPEATGGVVATKAAEGQARELGVRLSDVKGTGSGGRVLVRDVERAAKRYR